MGHMAKKKSQNSNDEKETKFKVLINVLTNHAAKLFLPFVGPELYYEDPAYK